MDRRQRKTRFAIFSAFTKLLAKKSFNSITVEDIIREADVGRATFYAHFETKDFLLREFCEELFCHIFDSVENNPHSHRHIFNCDAPDSVFLHLFYHIEKNDNNILELLSSQNNDLFLKYFKSGLLRLVESQLELFSDSTLVPRDFLANHVSAAFVETLNWWLSHGRKETPEEIYKYFFAVTGCNKKLNLNADKNALP